MGLDHRPIRVANAGKEDKPKQKGRVVRVERQPRRPPGPGYYTEEQLREWYNFYPYAKMEFVELVNGKRTQTKAYTPEELWRKRYFYAITRSSGTEVWLNDDGDGKVIGIERGLP